MWLFFIIVDWILVVGFYNHYLRKKGYSYGFNPVFTVLYYVLNAALAVIIVSCLGGVASSDVSTLSQQILVTLGVMAVVIYPLDCLILRKYSLPLRKRLSSSVIAKYSDILLQQCLLFLIFTLFTVWGASLYWIVPVFLLLHLPLVYFMPTQIATTFILASVGGGLIFATSYAFFGYYAFVVSAAIHAFFYSVLRFSTEDLGKKWTALLLND